MMLRIDRGPARGLLPLVAVVILSLLLLSACGGEDSDMQPQPATTVQQEREAAASSSDTAATAGPTVSPSSDSPEGTNATPGPAASGATPEPTDAKIVVVGRATEVPAASEPTATPATAASLAAPRPIAAPGSTVAPIAQEPTALPGPTATPAAPPEPCEGARGGELANCAPEFAGTQEWINSAPFSLESQLGKVVLIDFWTYSCINCIRTLPFLQTWHERYADEGLVIVGVHTPEFEFEKVYDNVVQATKDMGVAWPVVQDNGRSVWSSYNNRSWPAKYLIDKDGVIRYRHFGEGKYAETEEQIRALLAEVGADAEAFVRLDAWPLPEDRQQRDSTFLLQSGGRVTPELFAGWTFTTLQGRGGIGQNDTYAEAAQVSYRRGDQTGVVAEFETPREVKVDHIYFQGPWVVGSENVRHARETDKAEDDFILLAYSARSVNAVLTSESGEPYKVVVKVNNEYLTGENGGEDVEIGEDGESYVMVTSPRAYYLVEHPTWMDSQYVQLYSTSDDFGLFSFTFGTYEDGF